MIVPYALLPLITGPEDEPAIVDGQVAGFTLDVVERCLDASSIRIQSPVCFSVVFVARAHLLDT